MKKLIVVVSAVVLAVAGQSLYAAGQAQAAPGSHGNAHSSMNMNPPGANDAVSTKAFKQANSDMHQNMGILFTGDADVDYMRGMLAHHQGAIDMSEVVLAHGKDAEVLALAKNVIKEQEAEMGQIRAWLSKRGL